MKLFTVSFAVFFLYGVSTADIQTEKEAALKKMEILANKLNELHKKMNNEITSNSGRVTKIYEHITAQGEKIQNHNLFEMMDEAKSYYLKADILNSPLSVYFCISKTANTGDVNIKKDYEIFKQSKEQEYHDVTKKQQQDIDNWKAAVNKMEVSYKSDQQSFAKNIYEATTLPVIKSLVEKFEGISRQFEVQLESIDRILKSSQTNYLTKLQADIVTLRTKLITTKNKAFEELKKCVPC